MIDSITNTTINDDIPPISPSKRLIKSINGKNDNTNENNIRFQVELPDDLSKQNKNSTLKTAAYSNNSKLTNKISTDNNPTRDNRSRDNTIYLAKNLRPPTTPITPKFHVSSSSSSSGNRNNNNNYSNNNLPLPIPRNSKSYSTQNKIKSSQQINGHFSPKGKYYSKDITVDSRDGKGYGRKIKILPRLTKELFLNNKNSCIQSNKKTLYKDKERLRLLDKNVNTLIIKFQALTPEDYDHMIIHHFGFEKIYSISEIILQEYNPHPNDRSPYRTKNTIHAKDHKDNKYEDHILDKNKNDSKNDLANYDQGKNKYDINTIY